MQVQTQYRSVECELITTFARLEELETAWRRWSRCDPRAAIFQQWEWLRAFWRTYGDVVSLCSPAVHAGGAVIGILPLVRRGAKLEFLGAPHSDYNDVLCEERDAAVVVEAALSHLLRAPVAWDACVLDNLPEHSRIVRHMPRLSVSLRKHLQLVFRYPSPAVLITGGDSGILDGLIRKDRLAKYHRRLRKLGDLTFRHLEQRDEARQHLRQFFEQHIARCVMAGRPSQFLQPGPRRFYTALVDELDPRAQLRFGVLELNSKAIAYHFSFQAGDRFVFYTPSFNVDYSDQCPGQVLLRCLLQYARDCDVREFDFSIGDEPYKHRFANAIRRNYALCVEAHPAQPVARVRAAVREVEAAVRERPRLKAVLDGIAGRIGTAVQDAGLLWGSRRAAVRTALWVHEDALWLAAAFTGGSGASPEAITRGTLENLARLSVEYPRMFRAKGVQHCRERLKRGDNAFLVRRGDDSVFLFWVRREARLAAPGTAARYGIALPAEVSVLYEISSSHADRPGGIPAAVLSAVIRQCGGELWTYCRQRDQALCRSLQAAGFQPRYMVEHWAVLHWLHRTVVLPCQSALMQNPGERCESWQSADASR